MSISRIAVNSRQSLDFTVTSYLAKGFVVANSTSDRVTLQKRKEFKMLWAVIGFLLCLLPLLIYLIVYALQPEIEIIEVVMQ